MDTTSTSTTSSASTANRVTTGAPGDASAPDPQRDLVFEREVDLPAERIWAAWTQPSNLLHWFTPAPWTTVGCEIDLRPGGLFRTVMRSPEGQEHDNTGCYLELVENRRLVWTDALGPGYRPREKPFITASIELTPSADGTTTSYRAVARHASVEDCARHEAMGFREGWGEALDQLVAHMKKE
jgi:uncharacterized protein YndB with AHSA1/START domain